MTRAEAMKRLLDDGAVQLVVLHGLGGVTGVPSKYPEREDLRLNFSYGFGKISLDEAGVSQRLRFGGVDWADVFVPWPAVAAILGTSCMVVFPTDEQPMDKVKKSGVLRVVSDVTEPAV